MVLSEVRRCLFENIALLVHPAQLQAIDRWGIRRAHAWLITEQLHPIKRRLGANSDLLCSRCDAVAAIRDLRHSLALELFSTSDPSRRGPILLASGFTLQGVYRSRGTPLLYDAQSFRVFFGCVQPPLNFISVSESDCLTGD